MGAAQQAQEAQLVERRTELVRLRAKRLPWHEIAKLLGYASAGAACQDYQRMMEQRRRELAEATDDLLAQELETIDTLMREAWAVLERPHLMVSNGRVVKLTNPDGKEVPLRDDGPTLAAIAELRKLEERRARLLGLDKVNVNAGLTVRYEIPGVDLGALR